MKINHQIPSLEKCFEILVNKPEFKVIKKRDYIIFDYNLNDSHTFDEPESLEMRGIAFNEAGEIVSLGLHKFFNLGEKANQDIRLDGEEEAFEKIDGSMIRIIKTKEHPRGWVFGTRAGETDVSELAEQFIADKPWYTEFIDHCVASGFWPIFELCVPENRVVIAYEEPALTLIAVRLFDGSYIDYSGMGVLSSHFGVPLVTKVDLQHVLAHFKYMTGIEGFVIRTNGDWVKLKTTEYCVLHKTLDGVKFNKDVAQMVLSGVIDDAIPMLTEPRRSEVIVLRDAILQYINETRKYVSEYTAELSTLGLSRKDIALRISKHLFRAEIFAALDGRLDQAVNKRICSATRTINEWAAFEKEYLNVHLNTIQFDKWIEQQHG